jgi:hypothetical protein
MSTQRPAHDIHARIEAIELELRSLKSDLAPLRAATSRPRAARLRRAAAVLVTAALLVGVPMIVVASDRFTDVPDGHTFHDQINALAGAGITTGCGAGLYCPSDPVTRGQMAGFLHRGLGRVAESSGFYATALEAVGTYTVRSLTIDNGGTGGELGWLLVTGAVSFEEQSDMTCPCTIRVRLRVDGFFSNESAFAAIDNTGGPWMASTWRFANASINEVFDVDGGETSTVELVVTVTRTNAAAVGLAGTLTAVWVPFGASDSAAQGAPAGRAANAANADR